MCLLSHIDIDFFHTENAPVPPPPQPPVNIDRSLWSDEGVCCFRVDYHLPSLDIQNIQILKLFCILDLTFPNTYYVVGELL